MSETPLLDVEDLNVSFPGRGGTTHAVRKATFSLGRERLGIVGESGSGKSTTGRALLGLLPPGLVTAKRMDFNGKNLLGFKDADWQELRGRSISMVMQDPKYSLNPVIKVGRQIQETYLLHYRTRYGIPISSLTSTRINSRAAWASA
jgi:peptide/nickel transport system ATP-binding protein